MNAIMAWEADGRQGDKPTLPEKPEVKVAEPVGAFEPTWRKRLFDSSSSYFAVVFAPDEVTDLILQVMHAQQHDLFKPSLDTILEEAGESDADDVSGEENDDAGKDNEDATKAKKRKEAWRKHYKLLWASPPTAKNAVALKPYESLLFSSHIGAADKMKYMVDYGMARQVLQWVIARAWPVDWMLKDGVKLLQAHHYVCLKIWLSSGPSAAREGLPEGRTEPWTAGDVLAGNAYKQDRVKGAKIPVFPSIAQMPKLAAEVVQSRLPFSARALKEVCEGMHDGFIADAVQLCRSWHDLFSLHDIDFTAGDELEDGDLERNIPDEDDLLLRRDKSLNEEYRVFLPLLDPGWKAIKVDRFLATLSPLTGASKKTELYEPMFFPNEAFAARQALFGSMAGSGNLLWLQETKLKPR